MVRVLQPAAGPAFRDAFRDCQVVFQLSDRHRPQRLHLRGEPSTALRYGAMGAIIVLNVTVLYSYSYETSCSFANPEANKPAVTFQKFASGTVIG